MTYTILSDYSAAQLVRVHNLYAHKPVAKFETRARAADRTAIALQAAGVTARDGLIAAGLLDAEPDAAQLAAAEAQVEADMVAELLDAADPVPVPHALNLAEPAPEPFTTLRELHPLALQAKLGLSPGDADWLVDLIAREISRPAEPPRLRAAALGMGRPQTPRPNASRPVPTARQQALIDAAAMPGGATPADLKHASGWPTIAARSVLENLGNRFGYAYSVDRASAPARHMLTKTEG